MVPTPGIKGGACEATSLFTETLPQDRVFGKSLDCAHVLQLRRRHKPGAIVLNETAHTAMAENDGRNTDPHRLLQGFLTGAVGVFCQWIAKYIELLERRANILDMATNVDALTDTKGLKAVT